MLIVLSAWPAAAQAQLANRPDLRLSVFEVKFDPATRGVDIDFANNGPQPIAAFGRSLKARFADGTDWEGHVTSDISHWLVFEEVFRGMAMKSPMQSLKPGEHYHEHTEIPEIPGRGRIMSVTAAVTATVSSDGTATGDGNELAKQHEAWKTELGDLRGWLSEMSALRHSNDLDGDSKRLAQKAQRAQSLGPESGHAGTQVTVQRYAEQVSAAVRAGTSDDGEHMLEVFIKLSAGRIALLERLAGQSASR